MMEVMEVVEVVRPSMVWRGCWHLSPASTTTGCVFRRLNVDAMVSKMADEIIEASSTTTRTSGG